MGARWEEEQRQVREKLDEVMPVIICMKLLQHANGLQSEYFILTNLEKLFRTGAHCVPMGMKNAEW